MTALNPLKRKAPDDKEDDLLPPKKRQLQFAELNTRSMLENQTVNFARLEQQIATMKDAFQTIVESVVEKAVAKATGALTNELKQLHRVLLLKGSQQSVLEYRCQRLEQRPVQTVQVRQFVPITPVRKIRRSMDLNRTRAGIKKRTSASGSPSSSRRPKICGQSLPSDEMSLDPGASLPSPVSVTEESPYEWSNPHGMISDPSSPTLHGTNTTPVISMDDLSLSFSSLRVSSQFDQKPTISVAPLPLATPTVFQVAPAVSVAPAIPVTPATQIASSPASAVYSAAPAISAAPIAPVTSATSVISSPSPVVLSVVPAISVAPATAVTPAAPVIASSHPTVFSVAPAISMTTATAATSSVAPSVSQPSEEGPDYKLGSKRKLADNSIPEHRAVRQATSKRTFARSSTMKNVQPSSEPPATAEPSPFAAFRVVQAAPEESSIMKLAHNATPSLSFPGPAMPEESSVTTLALAAQYSIEAPLAELASKKISEPAQPSVQPPPATIASSIDQHSGMTDTQSQEAEELRRDIDTTTVMIAEMKTSNDESTARDGSARGDEKSSREEGVRSTDGNKMSHEDGIPDGEKMSDEDATPVEQTPDDEEGMADQEEQVGRTEIQTSVTLDLSFPRDSKIDEASINGPATVPNGDDPAGMEDELPNKDQQAGETETQPPAKLDLGHPMARENDETSIVSPDAASSGGDLGTAPHRLNVIPELDEVIEDHPSLAQPEILYGKAPLEKTYVTRKSQDLDVEGEDYGDGEESYGYGYGDDDEDIGDAYEEDIDDADDELDDHADEEDEDANVGYVGFVDEEDDAANLEYEDFVDEEDDGDDGIVARPRSEEHRARVATRTYASAQDHTVDGESANYGDMEQGDKYAGWIQSSDTKRHSPPPKPQVESGPGLISPPASSFSDELSDGSVADSIEDDAEDEQTGDEDDVDTAADKLSKTQLSEDPALEARGRNKTRSPSPSPRRFDRGRAPSRSSEPRRPVE